MTQSFYPPTRTLMGPGPSNVNPRILEALSRPTIGHLDPAFIGLMNDVKRLLQFAFQTGSALTMPVSAPGSAGMETCFVNLISSGDKVIVAQNGVFGGRMQENVERCGGEAVMVHDGWGMPVDPQKVEDALHIIHQADKSRVEVADCRSRQSFEDTGIDVGRPGAHQGPGGWVERQGHDDFLWIRSMPNFKL